MKLARLTIGAAPPEILSMRSLFMQNFSVVIILALFTAVVVRVQAADSTAIQPSLEEQQIVDLANQQREQNGLAPLTVSPQLLATAREHSAAMANAQTLAHTLNGSTMTNRIKGSGYPYLAIGENVAFNQPTPAQVVKSWMESPGHRANILNKNYTEIGVGIANDADGNPYYTQDFGRPISAGPTESAKFSITNHAKEPATIVLPGSPNKSQLEPGSTGEFSVAGTEKLPPVQVHVGDKRQTLNFEDGGAYILKDSPEGLKIQSENAR